MRHWTRQAFMDQVERRLELQEAFVGASWAESSLRWQLFGLHLPLVAFSPCQGLKLQGDSKTSLDIHAEPSWTLALRSAV